MTLSSIRVRLGTCVWAFSLLASTGGIPAACLDLGKSMTQYAHRIWGQEEGLFQPTIYSILQTRDGFLWLGTQDSLIRFDGIHFREFAEGASVLHRSLVHSLLEDRDGNLWAASLGNGLLRISPSGAVKTYNTKSGLPSDSIFCLSMGRDGAVWACTTDGLVRIDRDRIQVFTTADGLPTNRIRTTCEAADGTRWIAGLDSGLLQWSHGRVTSYISKTFRSGESVTALTCAADGSLWVGTASGLLHLAESSTTTYTTRDGLPDNDVSALTEGPDRTLWIGTNNGVSRIHHGEVSVYSTRDGLSHSEVLALFLDREGSLWAGTKNGLDQFTDGKVTPYTTDEGLLSNEVGPVLEDHAGHLWIGTLGSGLDCFDGHRFHALTTAQGLVNNTVLSLALAPSGDLWVGTGGGINRIKNGAVAATYTAKDGLLGSGVRSLLVDARGTLWAGTNVGLQHLEGSRFVNSSPALHLGGDGVIALSGGHIVRLFASADKPALYVMRNDRLAPHPLVISHPVDCFLLEPLDHTIWMGTLGSGLLHWKNNVISHVYVRDGLYDNRIYSILKDDSSNFWLASSKGIFRLNERELQAFVNGTNKSVTSLPFSTGQMRFECRAGVQPAACRTKDGRLWFSTTNGLVVLDPNHLTGRSVPPPVAITALLVDGKPPLPDAELHLKRPQTNNLEIRYAGLSFVSPEKITFRYRLAGYETSWVDAGARREAFYTNLPSGRFEFLVEARNADGIWSTRPASVRFAVDPKFYQHAWFLPLFALLLGLTSFAAYRMRIRRLSRRFNLILAERNRIARELHDTVLQGLSGITMQMQALWTRLPASREKQLLAEIIKDAGTCSAEARRSLWGLRSQRPPSLNFSDKLVNLAHEAIRDKPIVLQLEVEPLSLSELPDAEYQLLRVAQEALANAIQHASASRLTVSLSAGLDRLLLQISDDGAGFIALRPQAEGHFGLQAMRERAEEIGADLAITSKPGNGTCVAISLLFSRRIQQLSSNRQALNAHQTD